MQVALSGPSGTDCCCSILVFSAQCTLALGGLRSAMESWETVGGGKKTTKAAGQGHRPRLSGGALGGLNRGQGERSRADAPNKGATRHGSRGVSPVQISVARAQRRPNDTQRKLRRPAREPEEPHHLVGPKHGDLPPSPETASESDEASPWPAMAWVAPSTQSLCGTPQ